MQTAVIVPLIVPDQIFAIKVDQAAALVLTGRALRLKAGKDEPGIQK
jgi:hypothetical protein